jgi:hypothetical protein
LGQLGAKVAKMFGRRYWQAIEASTKCRFSSAVEQRFCKPKVGSSILSTGTMRRVPSLLAPDACHRPSSGCMPDVRRTALWARRCLRRESRRIILAFAARTASILIDRFLGDALLGLLPVVRIIGCSGVGLVEPCSAGCMFMGPVDGDLRRGITDNAQRSALFV